MGLACMGVGLGFVWEGVSVYGSGVRVRVGGG